MLVVHVFGKKKFIDLLENCTCLLLLIMHHIGKTGKIGFSSLLIRVVPSSHCNQDEVTEFANAC